MAKYTYLNAETFESFITELFKDETSERSAEIFDDMIREYVNYVVEQCVNDMDKYVHQTDHRIIGNFNNISRDWNNGDKCHTDIEPWGTFDEIVAGMDNGTLSNEDAAKVQEWMFAWFIDTFGTFGLTYKYSEWLGELEYEFEMADLDEFSDEIIGLSKTDAVEKLDTIVEGLEFIENSTDEDGNKNEVYFSTMWRITIAFDANDKVLSFKYE